MFRKPGLRTFVALAVAAAIVGASAAAFAGENDVKFRQSTMKAVGGHMAAMAAIIKGEVKHASHLRGHAAAMASLGKMAPDVFLKGSEGGSTKPEAWSKPEDFSAGRVRDRVGKPFQGDPGQRQEGRRRRVRRARQVVQGLPRRFPRKEEITAANFGSGKRRPVPGAFFLRSA